MLARIKPYLQLVRAPNVFTAAADPLAGLLLVGGTYSEFRLLAPRVFASCALYAAGIALNDLCDLEVDRRERPSRPLPSGAVSISRARLLIISFVVFAFASILTLRSLTAATVFVLLLAAVSSYNLWTKHTPLGPLNMGLCRGLNLLLGMTAASGMGGPIGWLACSSYGLFVCGATLVSRSEAGVGGPKPVIAGALVENLGLLGLFVTTMSGRRFPHPSIDLPIVPIVGLSLLAFTALLVNLFNGEAIRSPTPAKVQTAVKTAVLSLVWLDAALVSGVRGPGSGAIVAALWFPAFLLAKWLYAT